MAICYVSLKTVSVHVTTDMFIILNVASSLRDENRVYQFLDRITVKIFDINLMDASKIFL